MEELLVGFRFYPTEEELLSFYLPIKLQATREDIDRVIPVVPVFDFEPWDLPDLAGKLCRGDAEQWFFFVPRQEREARGGRPSRTTASGYWKATGSPGYVYSLDNRVIGVKKTMVYYKGKAPNGTKTKWKMNEYRAIEGGLNVSSASVPQLRHEFSLCRLYVTSGSSRAFDRRPSEASAAEEARLADDMGATSHAGAMAARASPSEASFSGGDLVDKPDNSGQTKSWGMSIDLEQPRWDWEQLDWL